MCVLCSEFSCRVGNNHQIQRREKKEEDELLAQQTFPFFLLFLGASSLLYSSAGYWCHQWTRWRLLGVRPNSRYILLMQCYQVYILRPITTHNPLSKEMFDHHFLNWLPFVIEYNAFYMYDSGFPFYCIYTSQGTHPGNVNLCTTLVELYQEDSQLLTL